MWLANLKIGPKLAVGYATVLLTAAVATMMVGFAVMALDKADTTNASAYRTIADIQTAAAAHLKQSQSLLGTVLTHADSAAANYDAATKEFASRMAAAKANSENLPDASEIAALIDKMAATGKSWQNKVGDPTLKLARNPQTYDQAMEAAKTSTTDQNEAGFQEAQNALNDKLTALCQDLRMAHGGKVSFVYVAQIVGALAAFAMALLIGFWFLNTIATPVHQMTDVMKRLAAGDNEVEVPAKGRKDFHGPDGRAGRGIPPRRDSEIAGRGRGCRSAAPDREGTRTARGRERRAATPFRNRRRDRRRGPRSTGQGRSDLADRNAPVRRPPISFASISIRRSKSFRKRCSASSRACAR